MNMINTIKHSLVGFLAVLATFTMIASPGAQESEEQEVHKGQHKSDLIVSGDHLLIEAEIESDLIAAGAKVNVQSDIKGDVLIVGGNIDIGETIKGGLMLMGGNAYLTGEIGNDVSVFAGRSIFKGTIRDDALAIGGRLDFDGDVHGDVRALAGKINLRKHIDGDVLGSAGIFRIEDSATITGKATIGGGKIRVGGHVVGDLRIGGGDVVIAGRIDGDVKIAARTIKVLPSARIKGNLTYHSPSAIQLSDQAEVGGDITYNQSDDMTDTEGGMFAAAGASHIILVIGLVLLATAFVLAIPKLFPALDRQSRGRNLTCVGVGLAVLIGGPVLISLLFVSAIGIPLGILLIAVYFLMVITGQFGSSYVLGRRLITWSRHDATKRPLHRVGATALGLCILWLLAVIPVLGVIVVILATARGVGALVFECLELRARLGQPV